MKKKYVIGLDYGTLSGRAVLVYCADGTILASAVKNYEHAVMDHSLPGGEILPGADWALQYPQDYLDVLAETVHTVVQKGSVPKEDIIGIGLCTIRSCRVFLRGDGSLAQPVMSWLDKRAFGPIDVGDSVRYVTTTTGYFTHRLTGNFCDTAANNTKGQWPIDPYHWDWTDDPQKYIDFHISRSMLLPLELPGKILGYLTPSAAKEIGLPAGIPVVSTANDKAVEALGAGLLGSDTGLVSLGTYITSMVSGTEFIDDTEDFFCNFSCIPNYYLHESSGIWRGMWTISWLVDLFEQVKREAGAQNICPEEILNREAAQIPPGSEGLMTVMEWLCPQPHKKGIMIGFDVRHTRAHMYRSMIEGIAMTMWKNFKVMCDTVQANPQKLIVSGGGANSDVFMQVFADVFGMPATRNTIASSAGLGSAICAAVATEVYPSFQEAIANMVRVRDHFYPDQARHNFYTRLNNEVYSKLSEQMDPLLLKLQSI